VFVCGDSTAGFVPGHYHLIAPRPATWMCAAGQKEGGQALLGGLDCRVQRNVFGAQINSFETDLPVPPALREGGSGGGGNDGAAADSEPATYPAMFIRAPGILEAGSDVEVLSGAPAHEVFGLRSLCLCWCHCGEERKPAAQIPGPDLFGSSSHASSRTRLVPSQGRQNMSAASTTTAVMQPACLVGTQH